MTGLAGPGRYEPISERLAMLRMNRNDAPFGIKTGKYLLHRVGLADAPLYEIQQPLAPSDDMWEFRRAADGRFIETRSAGASELESSVARWASRSAAKRSFELCSLLPTGDYYLVRTALKPQHAPVLVGNGRDRAANFILLLDDPRFFVFAVGPSADFAPDLAQPLLGLPILRYTTAPFPVGIVCLPFLDAPIPAGYDGQDLILIIPTQGDLVLDALGPLPPDPERRNLRVWTDELAREFARMAAHIAPGSGAQQ